MSAESVTRCLDRLEATVRGLREDLHDMECCRRRSGEDPGIGECRQKLADAERELGRLRVSSSRS